ncbi:hypothetical protein Q7P35_006801 [Cladosporium inversicolor]
MPPAAKVAKHKKLSQQERIAAVILYMKGSWQQDEIAAELGLSSSAISKAVQDCKASASDDSLRCEYLRPTSGTTPRAEKRGNIARIPRGSASKTASLKAAVNRHGCFRLHTDASTSDWFEADKAHENPPPHLNVRQEHRQLRLDAATSMNANIAPVVSDKLAWLCGDYNTW